MSDNDEQKNGKPDFLKWVILAFVVYVFLSLFHLLPIGEQRETRTYSDFKALIDAELDG